MKVKVFWNIFKLKVVRNSNKHNESINKHHRCIIIIIIIIVVVVVVIVVVVFVIILLIVNMFSIW